MYRDEKDYRVYESDDLKHGSELKIEHSVYFYNDPDISKLITMPLDKIQTMREESATNEDAAFAKLKTAFNEWEKHAAVTKRLDRAIAYLKVSEVEHTSNQWRSGNYDDKEISNKVYSMSYSFFEYTSYRTDDKKRCEVNWNLYINTPKKGYGKQIAGQRKSYASREEAEKYMQGRIKAYSHLFTEISPPIPKEYKEHFTLYGQLLPGYTIEGEQREQGAAKSEKVAKKPSIRKQLKQNTEKSVSAPKPEKTKSKGNIEL